jgi:long-chain fatty acid transport protein
VGNPAGTSRLRTRQLVGALHVITPSINFNNEASVSASQQSLGGAGGDAGGPNHVPNYVPNLYFSMPINQAWSFGVGFTAPWGLVTDYEGSWAGRFQAVKSRIKTMNLNPAVSLKVANNVALGLGLNVQRIEGEFTNHLNYSGALLSAAAAASFAPGSPTFSAIAAATLALEWNAMIKDADTGKGWNIGMLWDLDPNSRLGLSYRSRVSYTLSGDATFTNPVLSSLPALAQGLAKGLAKAVNVQKLSDSGISSEVKMPEIVNISYFRAMGRWDIMADAQWTGWSAIQDLTFFRKNGEMLTSTPENFKDAWKFAVGANWEDDPVWTVCGGLACDQSPVHTAYRTARLPDANKTWLTLGGQHKMSDEFQFDLGTAYLWVNSGQINQNGGAPTGSGLLNGFYNSSTWILSSQAAWSF